MADLPIGAHRSSPTSARLIWPFIAALLLLITEMAAASVIYKHFAPFECLAMAPQEFCRGASSFVLRAIAVTAALGIFAFARPDLAQRILHSRRPFLHGSWGGLHGLGLVTVMVPLAFLAEGVSGMMLGLAGAMWLTGATMLGVGTVFALVAPKVLWPILRQGGWPLVGLLTLALLTPEIAALAQMSWYIPAITEATFDMVVVTLQTLGENTYVNIEQRHIGVGTFVVSVWHTCSGVEGFALITSFLALYIWLFRERLRISRAWILIPIGLLLSWCLNVVRIAVLIWIGAYHSPELAIDGFHSHAGWLMFTILSVGCAALAHQIAWFRKDILADHTMATAQISATRQPFFQDPVAAQIFPFLVFMASALLASTFSQTPSLLYPLRALAMAAALAAFWPVLSKITWRPDPLAMGAGAIIGVLWLVTAPPAGAADTALITALTALPPALFALWVASRIIGTAILVPVIEELFFRGYILKRLDRGGQAQAALVWRLLALAVSAALFAALHDRWLAAGLAGLVFGLLYLRRGQIADAIWAHAAANAIIAGWALWQGDWSVI